MAISNLVTGNAFQRPAITFSNKQTEYKLEKVSFLLNSKSSMADLGSAMSNLNTQLLRMQNLSKDIIRSISSILNTITKLDKDMTNRFRRLNKEINDSRTEFTRSLANLTPSLAGGATAIVNPAALGPVGVAGAAAAAIPSSGNSKWDAFMAFVSFTAPTLFKKLGTKFALMAGLATVPFAGWVLDALVFVTVIADAIELYNLWCQFSNQKPDQAAIDAAQATQTKPQTPAGTPQQTTPPPPASTGAPQQAQSLQDPTNPATFGRGGGRTPVPTDMSISGETGSFGATRQSAIAPQPMRRPTEASSKPVGVPAASAPPIDPHAKSKAMFQAAQDAEREGGSGATALFFAADAQRQKELAGLKQVTTTPGAPVEAKKAAAKSLRDASNPATFGRGGGHTTGETRGAIGRGGGDHVDPRMLGRGAGNRTLPTEGLAGGETGMSEGDISAANMMSQANRLAPIQGPMQSMADKQSNAQAAGRYDIDDDSMSSAVSERAALETDLTKREAIASGQTPASVRGTLRQAGEQIKPNAVDKAQGAPTSSPTAPAAPTISPEFEPGYSGKAGKILQYNMNEYNATQTSQGGEGNNTAGQNLPLTAKNPWLEEFIARQPMIYQ
jgi:hypothetical protein